MRQSAEKRHELWRGLRRIQADDHIGRWHAAVYCNIWRAGRIKSVRVSRQQFVEWCQSLDVRIAIKARDHLYAIVVSLPLLLEGDVAIWIPLIVRPVVLCFDREGVYP